MVLTASAVLLVIYREYCKICDYTDLHLISVLRVKAAGMGILTWPGQNSHALKDEVHCEKGKEKEGDR